MVTQRLSFVFFFFLALVFAVQSQASTFVISSRNATVEFSVKHFRLDTVDGEFKQFVGSLEWDRTKKTIGSLKGIIFVDSLDTDNRSRDNHLQSDAFFNVLKFPLISFVSTSVSAKEKGFDVSGTLTMHGVSRPITIPFEVTISDTKVKTARFISHLRIKRSDFGMMESLRLIGDDVVITLAGNLDAPDENKGDKK